MNAAEAPPKDMETTQPFWIGVHVLSQFVFCSRAGISAHENPESLDDCDEWESRLGVMPRYELEKVKEAFTTASFRTCFCAAGVVASFLISHQCAVRFDPRYLLAGMVIACLLFLGVAKFGMETLELFFRRQALENAKPREPDPFSENSQPVHWGEMLKAGFEPRRLSERLVHEAWKLKGKPFIVLRRHGVQIPVILMPEDSDKVHEKYEVRIAAYCHLLERSENAKCPYGIVLKANSFEGFTVPNNHRVRTRFQDELSKARQILATWRDSRRAPNTAPPSYCAACPCGEPKPYVPDKSEHRVGTIPLPIVPVSDGTCPIMHSECGDRFHWVPPHEKIAAKNLKRTGN